MIDQIITELSAVVSEMHPQLVPQFKNVCERHAAGKCLPGEYVWLREIHFNLYSERKNMAATKTAPKPSKKARKPKANPAPEVLAPEPETRKVEKTAGTFPAKFASVNVTTNKVAIGVTVARPSCSLEAANALFVASELRIRMTCDPNSADDTPGQQKFTDDNLDANVVAVTGAVSMKTDRFTFGLSIDRDKRNTDAEHLLRFANSHGQIEVERIGDAKSNGEEGQQGDDPTE